MTIPGRSLRLSLPMLGASDYDAEMEWHFCDGSLILWVIPTLNDGCEKRMRACLERGVAHKKRRLTTRLTGVIHDTARLICNSHSIPCRINGETEVKGSGWTMDSGATPAPDGL